MEPADQYSPGVAFFSKKLLQSAVGA